MAIKDKQKNAVPLPAHLSYEDARDLMTNLDPDIRSALAQHKDTPEEVLYFLAEDENAEVRCSVAQNMKTPRHANLILTKDTDPRVRHQLTNKIGRILPDLSDSAKEVVTDVMEDILTQLAQDEVDYIRQMLSDMVKDLPNIPKEVIHILANDTSLTVAEPVLQFSPVLNDQDLLDIINTHPLRGVIAVISKRSSISGAISGAIIKTGELDAIKNLLENKSSTIDDADMETILALAPNQEAWHHPLITRPKLSKKTVLRLADFVAMQMLDELQRRTDFDDDILIHLTQAIEKRIAEDIAKGRNSHDMELQNLYAEGKLDENFIADALRKGNKDKVAASISIMSAIAKDIVLNTLTKPRPKRICALCYKAKLSAKMAQTLQTKIAKLPKSLVLTPTAEGDYSMPVEELIEVLNELD